LGVKEVVLVLLSPDESGLHFVQHPGDFFTTKAWSSIAATKIDLFDVVVK
jgi:hypothetical protein